MRWVIRSSHKCQDECRSATRIPQTTRGTPARQAANRPTRLAWNRNVCRTCVFRSAKQPGQAGHDPKKLGCLARPQTLDFHAGRLECGNERRLAGRRGGRQAVNHRRETVSVEPRGQFDQAPLGPADVQIRNAQCNARHGLIPYPGTEFIPFFSGKRNEFRSTDCPYLRGQVLILY